MPFECFIFLKELYNPVIYNLSQIYNLNYDNLKTLRSKNSFEIPLRKVIAT